MKPKALAIGAFALLAACRQTNVPPPAPPAASAAPQWEAHRPVYRNSVLPGGVETGPEVASRLSADPVAAAHYRGVAVSKLRPVRLAKARMAYVSYRTPSGIYWTKNRVPLREGELVLTDGGSEVRGRCGNRISNTPEQPVAQNEPPAEAFDETTPNWPSWGTVATEASEHANHTLSEQGAAVPVTSLASQPAITSPLAGDPATAGGEESSAQSGLFVSPLMGGGGGVPPGAGIPSPSSNNPGGGAGSTDPAGPGIADPSTYPPPSGSGVGLMPPRTAPTASAPWTLPPLTDPDPGGENPPVTPDPPGPPIPPDPPGVPPPPFGPPPPPPPHPVPTPEPSSRLAFLLGAAMLAVLGIAKRNRQS